MTTRAGLGTLLLLLPLVLAIPSPSPSVLPTFPRYTLTDLGTFPGGDQSYAWAISETGAVVGGTTGSDGMRAFLWTRQDGMVPLPCPAGRPYCIARDVNANLQVAGSAWETPMDTPGHAVRWSGGAPKDLGTLGSGLQSEAWGINRAGTVVGYSWTGSGIGPHAFVYDDARGMVDLSGDPGAAYDINDAGEIAGHEVAGDGDHAFLWGDGTALEFSGVSGLTNTYALAVNEEGRVAGYARSSSLGSERVVRSGFTGALENLGGLGDRNRGWGINRLGDVVGEARFTDGTVRAVLYTDATGMQDLHLYLDPAIGWFLFAATDINDAGQIVGYGSDPATGRTHAFLLSPPSYTGVPSDLMITAPDADTVRLSWAPPMGADSYRVYATTDRFAPFPWDVVGTTTDTWFDLRGHLSDGADHFYVVRAISHGLEGPMSGVAVKAAVDMTYDPGRTNIAWLSLPYRSGISRASDLAALIGKDRIDVIGRWDATRQESTVYYHTGGPWRGVDFPIAPGDGLYVGLRTSFSLVLLGTDGPQSLTFSKNAGPMGSAAWTGLPFTGAYRHASDLAAELGPGRVVEVGKWDPATQSSLHWSWTGSAWAGTDFGVAPGDGVYFVVASDFVWTPRVVAPTAP